MQSSPQQRFARGRTFVLRRQARRAHPRVSPGGLGSKPSPPPVQGHRHQVYVGLGGFRPHHLSELKAASMFAVCRQNPLLRSRALDDTTSSPGCSRTNPTTPSRVRPRSRCPSIPGASSLHSRQHEGRRPDAGPVFMNLGRRWPGPIHYRACAPTSRRTTPEFSRARHCLVRHLPRRARRDPRIRGELSAMLPTGRAHGSCEVSTDRPQATRDCTARARASRTPHVKPTRAEVRSEA